MIAPGIYSTWDARWTERYYDWAWHLLYVGFWSTWDCKKIGVPSRSLSASPAKIDCAGAGPHAIPLYFLSLKHIIIHNAWPFIGFPRPTVPAVPADWQMTDVLHAVHALWAPAKFGVSGSSPPPPGVSTENGAISASSIIPKDRNLMNETAEICWKIGTWLWRICGSIFRSSDYVQASSVLILARAMPHRSPRTWTPARYIKNYLDVIRYLYYSWQHSQTSWKRWMSKRPGHDLHLDLTMDLRQAPVPVKT